MPDWQFIDLGGTSGGDRIEENQGQCPCEKNWDVEFEEQDYDVQPNQNDIAALFQHVKPPKLGTCSGDCKPKLTFYGGWWMLYKNKKTGVLRLRCAKRVAWHCELSRTVRRPRTLSSRT
jgi:hypothetical protein